MSVVVAYKWTSNPQDASVREDGTVDWSRAKAAMSEDDPVAVQFARGVADAVSAELVGVSVGTSQAASPMARKSAMSRGMDRGLVVAEDDTATWTLTQTAEALAALVRRVDGADLLVTGDASIDQNAKMVPAITAGFLGWPAFADVTGVERDGAGWTITQHTHEGTRTVRVEGPAVVSTTTDVLTAKVPGMKDILAAAKKTVDVVPAAELGLTAAPLEVTDRRIPEKQVRKRELFSGPDAVEKLVAALKSEGLA